MRCENVRKVNSYVLDDEYHFFLLVSLNFSGSAPKTAPPITLFKRMTMAEKSPSLPVSAFPHCMVKALTGISFFNTNPLFAYLTGGLPLSFCPSISVMYSQQIHYHSFSPNHLTIP